MVRTNLLRQCLLSRQRISTSFKAYPEQAMVERRAPDYRFARRQCTYGSRGVAWGRPGLTMVWKCSRVSHGYGQSTSACTHGSFLPSCCQQSVARRSSQAKEHSDRRQLLSLAIALHDALDAKEVHRQRSHICQVRSK